MVMQILVHTPRWVFALFLVLLVIGISQLAARRVTLRRITVLPLAMLGWSFYGVMSAFSTQTLALFAWALGGAIAAAGVLARPLPAGTAYDAATRSFVLAGSAVPLLLLMGLFFAKYAVGVTLALAPQFAQHAPFALPVGALYGLLSGAFLGRALRLWRLARDPAVAIVGLRAAGRA